ncbi:hypothetical protein HDU96_007784, partial [Phlyctochytrium bullatum]
MAGISLTPKDPCLPANLNLCSLPYPISRSSHESRAAAEKLVATAMAPIDRADPCRPTLNEVVCRLLFPKCETDDAGTKAKKYCKDSYAQFEKVCPGVAARVKEVVPNYAMALADLAECFSDISKFVRRDELERRDAGNQ